MLLLNSKGQSNQKRDRTVKTRKPILEKGYKKRRKIRTRQFIISNKF